MLPWFLKILAISSMTLAALPQSPETGFFQRKDLGPTNERQRLFNEWPISEFHEEIDRFHSNSCVVKTSFGHIPSIEQSKL